MSKTGNEQKNRQGQGSKTESGLQKRRIYMEKRRNLTRSLSLAAVILLITVGTLLMLLKILGKAKATPRFIFLEEGSLDREYDAVCLIVRDEQLIKAPADGQFVPEYPQGSRLAKGQLLGQVVNENASARLSELNKAESDLIARRYELLNSEVGAEGRRIAEKKDLEIQALMSRYYLIDKVRDHDSLSNLGSALELALDQRSKDLAQVKFKDREYQQAQENYQNIKNLLDNSAVPLYMPESGIVSYAIDGLEDLKIGDLQDMESGDLFKQIRGAKNVDGVRLREEPVKVQTDLPVAKLIHGLHQHFIAFLPPGLAEEVNSVGRISAESLDNGSQLDRIKVLRAEETRQGTLLIAQANRGLEAMAGQRLARLAIRLNSHHGLKLPRQALIGFKPGQAEAGLKIVSGGYVKEIKVAVLDFNDHYVLIDNLGNQSDSEVGEIGEATMVVVNPGAVADGASIDNLD